MTVRDVLELLIAGARGLATFLGTFGLFFIVLLGVPALWQDIVRTSDPVTRWLGLSSLVCAGYAFFRLLNSIAKGGESAKRHAELYAAAIQLKEAGQALLDATVRGSRGEVISAELHWHHAIADVEALRPPPPASNPS